MKDELRKLGLSVRESEVYVYLLAHKEQTATIISNQTKTNRTVVYNLLDSLVEKGLVSSFFLNGVKRFSATKIEALKAFVESKQDILSELLPKLKKIKSEEEAEINIEVYKGVQGGLAVLKDIIRTGENYVAFGEDDSFQNIFGTLAEQYARQLKERKIKERLIGPSGQKVFSGTNSEIRYLPKEIRLPSITAVYGNKVAIVIFQKPYHAIVVESKDLSESYKNLFEFLWKIAKKE